MEQTLTTQPVAPLHSRGVIARNFLSLSAAALAGRLVALFTGIYIRRVLGVVAVGQLSWCTSVLSYFVLVINPGLETIAKRDVARDPRAAGRCVSLLLTLQLLLALVAFVLVTVFAISGARGPRVSWILALQAVGLLLLPLTLTWLLHANERMAPAACAEVVHQLLMLPLLFLFVHDPSHVVRYVLLAYPLRIGVILYLGWYATRRQLVRWNEVRLSLAGAGALLREAIPLGFSQVAILLYYNFDVIFLGFTRDHATVGLYSTAYSLMLVPMFLSTALANAYFPALSRSGDDAEGARRISREFLRVLTWAGFPLAAMGWAVGRYAVQLMYGAEFAASGIWFEFLSLNIALVFFNIGIAQPLTAWGDQQLYFIITAVAAAVNIAFNIVLIPRFGATGAVATTLLAEGVVMVGALLARRRIHRIPVWRIVSRPLVCALALAILVRGLVVVAHQSWWVALAAGLVAFTAGFWLFERETLRAVAARLWRSADKGLA